MKIKLITGINCPRCRIIEGPLKTFAEANGYEYVEIDVQQAAPEDLGDATMLPVIRIDDKQVDYDEVLAMIS